MKKLLVFDLDGTLAESKCPLSSEMADILQQVLQVASIAVISGGSYSQFEKQFLANLTLAVEHLEKVFLFPTCATSFYRYQNGWQQVYCQSLTTDQQQRIIQAFQEMFKQVGFSTAQSYGPILENRGTQITFSALGQQAPVELKKVWDVDFSKRMHMISLLKVLIPEFEIRAGGSTSIDITRAGIDKAYGIRQIESILGFQIQDMIFFGDALFEGGNDAPVKTTGVECMQVSGPTETIQKLNELLAIQ